MEWGQVLTIIFGMSAVVGGFVFLISKRIDDLKDSIIQPLDAKLTPINEKLDNHITDTNKKIAQLSENINENNDKLSHLDSLFQTKQKEDLKMFKEIISLIKENHIKN